MKLKTLLITGILGATLIKAQSTQPTVNTSVTGQTTTTGSGTNIAAQNTTTIFNTTVAPAPCNSCKVDSTGIQVNLNGTYFYYPKKTDGWQTLLVFLPVLLFGIILFIVIIWLNRSGFKLADMLSENSSSEIDVDNPDPEARKTIPFVTKKILPRSASRLAAFLSGLCSVAIATCATSYYFYIYFKTGRAPDLSNLFDILLSLGIGVVPYTVNKVSTAFKA